MRILHFCLIHFCITGCNHSPKPVATVNREVRTVERPKVIRVSQMPEEMAEALWLQSGVYRGLTDDEWIQIMIAIEAIEEQERERRD